MKTENQERFETIIDGKVVSLYTLKNINGLVTQITNFGGRIVSLWVPDRFGKFDDIVLGYESIDEYLNSNEKYFGALIGRCGNRITNGEFELDGINYKLAKNVGEDHLHGGVKGFNEVVWDANQVDDQTLELKYLSPHMEEGYPGNLEVKVVYTITNRNELKVEYRAHTNKSTLINLTHHSFFNLHGAGNGTINDHVMQINADSITEVNDRIVPTGVLMSVENTPMDFRKPTVIGERVDEDFDQLIVGRGYDHNWVLNPGPEGLNFAARVLEPKSGRLIEVYTNEPGMQFYGGNFLDGSDIGKQGKVYERRSAFCLETQHFPDAIHHKSFPSIVLNPGETYNSVCVYKFDVK